jgi:predicted MFS family arabinose efflux permease
VVLILGAVVFDLDIQASMIAHQSIVYGLDPTARSRLNALLLGTMFVGMSVGSALGSIALDRVGWRGVGVFGAVAAAACSPRKFGTRSNQDPVLPGFLACRP